MTYKVNTIFNINDKIYSINNQGDIFTYHISKITFNGIMDGKNIDVDITYNISNLENKLIATNINAQNIEKRYFLDKKDIIKHITDQL